MRKFLLIFLIALVACEAVEDTELGNWLSDIWNSITQWAKNAWNWLVQHGVADTIKNILLTVGEYAAKAFCYTHFPAPACDWVISAAASCIGLIVK